MSRRILVKVSPNGDVEIEAHGFRGKRCTDATKALEHALGKRASLTLKPEFHRAEERQPHRHQLGNGGVEP